MTSKRKYKVGSKVWIDAHDVLCANDVTYHVPRSKAVVTEILPPREPIPWVKELRVLVEDGTLQYSCEDALSRRWR